VVNGRYLEKLKGNELEAFFNELELIILLNNSPKNFNTKGLKDYFIGHSDPRPEGEFKVANQTKQEKEHFLNSSVIYWRKIPFFNGLGRLRS